MVPWTEYLHKSLVHRTVEQEVSVREVPWYWQWQRGSQNFEIIRCTRHTGSYWNLEHWKGGIILPRSSIGKMGIVDRRFRWSLFPSPVIHYSSRFSNRKALVLLWSYFILFRTRVNGNFFIIYLVSKLWSQIKKSKVPILYRYPTTKYDFNSKEDSLKG